MPQAAQRKQPLILVSEDYDPDIWRSLEEEESEFQSWVAVAQDIWGRGCFLPGQAAAVREGAAGLTLNKTMIIGAVGSAVGGLGQIATDAVQIAQRLKAIPQPFRRQRMSAFADELQRAAVLHHAIEKGLVTAMRTLHYKPQVL